MIVTLLQTALALGLAIVVNGGFWGKNFFRIAFYVPSILSSASVTLVFIWFYQKNGFLNGILSGVASNYPLIMLFTICLAVSMLTLVGIRRARGEGFEIKALDMLVSGLAALMDRAADPELIAGIEDIVRDWPGVRGYHDLQTRTAGSKVFVNIHIELDGDQTLYVAHGIGAGLKRAIVEAYPQVDLIVHKDPARNAQAARGGA